jgi:PST family polysaccharide transporter
MTDRIVSSLPPKNTLKKDAAFVYGGYVLRYLSLIILIPYYGRVLGPVSYGKVLAAMSLMNIVWMITNYGFSTTGAREMAAATTRAARSHIFGRQTMARFLLVPIGLLIGLVGTPFSPSLSDNYWFGALATLQGLMAAFNLGWLFQGVRQFRIGIIIEGLSYPFTLFFVLTLVHTPEDGVNVLVALCLASAVCLSIAYYCSRKSVDLVLAKLSEGIAEVRDSSVIFLSSISSIIMTSGSTYLLSLLSTSEQVGYFGAAERFVALGLGLMGPMAQVLMPTIANLHSLKSDRAWHLARKGFLLEIAYGAAVLICGVSLTPFVLPIIMGEQFEPSVRILQILSCLFPFAAFSHAISMYLLIPLRKEKLLIAATTFGVVVNVALALIFVHDQGAQGMAIARLCGEIATATALCIILVRQKMLKNIVSHWSR